MDVFGATVTAGGEFLRDAAIDGAYELGVFTALARLDDASLDEIADAIDLGRGRPRLRALLDVLAAIGAIGRRGERFQAAAAPKRPVVARGGWGLMGDVIRRDKPLHVSSGETTRRFHKHLEQAGAAAARELAAMLVGDSLLDIGGGTGTYTAAFLDAKPDARATLVEMPEVLELAREQLARFGDRVRFIEGDARVVPLGDGYKNVLLANVLHLHGPSACAELCAIAARAAAPGGTVAIKDLHVEVDRSGPVESLMFALNMAIYTVEGDVYAAPQIRGWLEQAGLVDIDERTTLIFGRRGAELREEPSVLLDRATGHGPEVASAAGELDATLARTQAAVWAELEPAARIGDAPPQLAFPRALRQFLSHAITLERAEAPARAIALERHYTDTMPRMRIGHLASTAEPSATFFHARLDWSRMPKFGLAIDRLFALLAETGVDPVATVGHPSAEAFRASTPTLASLFGRTYYGTLMPVLYGYPADLTHFAARGAEDGLDMIEIIDRYLTGPMVHELCHFAPDREALPPYLDEAISGWLGVHLHPETAYPEIGRDNAIYAAPWLSQVGQAFARAFGIPNVVRAHTGTVAWSEALPKPFVDAAIRIGWADWCSRRTAHFLTNTLEPTPWIAMALVAAGGRSLEHETYASLAATPLAQLAIPDDPAFDLAIVTDALRAMCLDNGRANGSFYARSRVPEAAIEIDAVLCRVTTPKRGEVDSVPSSYWLPPPVAARIAARGLTGYVLRLGDIPSIPDAAAAICDASPGVERHGFGLVAR